MQFIASISLVKDADRISATFMNPDASLCKGVVLIRGSVKGIGNWPVNNDFCMTQQARRAVGSQ